MRLLDLTLPLPADNLALDEALLIAAEEGQGGEVLRLWELPALAVIVGAGGSVAIDVNVSACETDGIPILRRSSGGGTVLLGPGCFCFSLVLAYDRAPGLDQIPLSNRYVLGRMQAALRPIAPTASIEGTSDLALISPLTQERPHPPTPSAGGPHPPTPSPRGRGGVNQSPLSPGERGLGGEGHQQRGLGGEGHQQRGLGGEGHQQRGLGGEGVPGLGGEGVSELEGEGFAVKISGNAQQRKRRYFLHHGTLLCGFNLEMIPKYLNAPERQPSYRHNRPHTDFVANLKVQSAELKALLLNEWQPVDEYAPVPWETVRQLVSEKYSRDDWNRRR